MMMHKDKKGIELGLNTIVIAVIALVVLVVMLVVFGARFGIFSGELSRCENYQGSCVSSGSCQNIGGKLIEKTTCPSNQECCVSGCSMMGGTIFPSECGDGESLPVTIGDGYCCKPKK